MPHIATAKGGVFFCFLFFLASASAAAAERLHPVAENPVSEVRVARLTGLAKVWGAVKFFHPRLAHTGIDWDLALVKAIPRVNASRTSQDYVAALDLMLVVLGDPNTHARSRATAPVSDGKRTPAEILEPVRLEAGILIIDPLAASRSDAPATTAAAFSTTVGLMGQAKAVLLDLRSSSRADAGEVSAREDFLLQLLPALLDRDIPLAARRYRMHNGYAPQKGSSTGGYYSGLFATTPTVLRAKAKTKTPPVAILVNSDSASLDVVMGLRSAGMAYVVQEGAAPSTMGTATIDLDDDIEVTVSTTQIVDPRGGVGFAADEIVATGQGPAAAKRALARTRRNALGKVVAPVQELRSVEKDDPYPEMAFPTSAYRLLALFRYWNVINYFFPYKDLIGSDWNEVLLRYIPRFEANQNAVDYETTLRALSAEIHDSHGFMGPTRAFARAVGAFAPPIVLRNVENQSMVVVVLDPTVPLRAGDVILDIDGQPTAARRDYFAQLYPASTPQAARSFVQPFLLRGQNGSMARLTVRGLDGTVRAVQVGRTLDAYSSAFVEAFRRSSPAVAVMASGVGYVDLARLQRGEVDRMFETIKAAKATIFDMRGYPNGTAWTVAPRLSKARNPVATRYARPTLDGAMLEDEMLFGAGGDLGMPSQQVEQRLPDALGERYSGRVVMLIDERAASQAEHTCLFFEAATDVTFVGTPTAGVDGDVTNMVLPGGITASFSGAAVRHADGRQLQRVGIQPTIRVAPTIAGLAAGRDEVLEAAIEFLAKGSVQALH